MPQKYRLSRADFEYARGFKRINGVFFNVSYGIIPSRGTPGGACIVSSKVARKAVVRNVIKRRARVALISLLKDAPPIVVMCHAKKGIERATSQDIRREIEGLSTRIPQFR